MLFLFLILHFKIFDHGLYPKFQVTAWTQHSVPLDKYLAYLASFLSSRISSSGTPRWPRAGSDRYRVSSSRTKRPANQDSGVQQFLYISNYRPCRESFRGKRATDRMMVAAAKALGNISRDSANNTATELLAPIENMRDVSIQIAVMVGVQAQQDGVAQVVSEQDLRERAQRRFWIPQYLSYKLIGKENISN